MDAVVLRGRRWVTGWVVLLLLLIAATRVAVVVIAVNGPEELPAQLLADAIAAAAVLYVAFGRDRVARWLGVLLFAAWGLASLWVAVRLGAAVTVSIRGGMTFLFAAGTAGVVVQALAVLTGVACLGFAVGLAGSHSVHRYLAYRCGQRTVTTAVAPGPRASGR